VYQWHFGLCFPTRRQKTERVDNVKLPVVLVLVLVVVVVVVVGGGGTDAAVVIVIIIIMNPNLDRRTKT
jgi:hypothetical protein